MGKIEGKSNGSAGYETAAQIVDEAREFTRSRWNQFSTRARNNQEMPDYWAEFRHDPHTSLVGLDYKLLGVPDEEFLETAKEFRSRVMRALGSDQYLMSDFTLTPISHLHLTIQVAPSQMLAEALRSHRRRGSIVDVETDYGKLLEAHPLHRRVQKITARTAPFDVSFEGINVYGAAVVIDVAPDTWPSLVEVSRALKKLPEFDYVKPNPFISPRVHGFAPHVVLGRFGMSETSGASANKYFDVMNEFRQSHPSFGSWRAVGLELSLGRAVVAKHFLVHPAADAKFLAMRDINTGAVPESVPTAADI